jgi:hypothetical protein
MSSIGTPELERSETKLCRNSRGVHSEAFKPAAAATVRNARRTFAASSSVPYRVANTRSLPTHCSPIRIRWASWLCRCARSASTQSAGSSNVRRDRFVFVSPPALTDRHS